MSTKAAPELSSSASSSGQSQVFPCDSLRGDPCHFCRRNPELSAQLVTSPFHFWFDGMADVSFPSEDNPRPYNVEFSNRYVVFGWRPDSKLIIIVHRRGMAPVGWLDLHEPHNVAKEMVARNDYGPTMVGNLCFHRLDGVADTEDIVYSWQAISRIILCPAGGEVGTAAPAPRPSEWRDDDPPAIGWEAIDSKEGQEGVCAAFGYRHSYTSLLIGVVAGWPLRVGAAPLLFIHRERMERQGISRLGALDYGGLRAVAEHLAASGEEHALYGPAKPRPRVCCHLIRRGGHRYVMRQVRAIEDGCMENGT